MLGLGFSTKDELDWRLDPDYLAAVAVVTTAKAEADRTEAARVAAWREDSIQGVNPPPDSRFWDVKRAATVAAQAIAAAVAVRDRAEATAKAACRAGVIDQYREQWSAVEDATDQLIDVLTAFEAVRTRASEIGVTLPWGAPDTGDISAGILVKWRDGNRNVIEQV